jgi:hypothetical protein
MIADNKQKEIPIHLIFLSGTLASLAAASMDFLTFSSLKA